MMRMLGGELWFGAQPSGHEVILLDEDPSRVDRDGVPGAQWLVVDTCELVALQRADLGRR